MFEKITPNITTRRLRKQLENMIATLPDSTKAARPTLQDFSIVISTEEKANRNYTS